MRRQPLTIERAAEAADTLEQVAEGHHRLIGDHRYARELAAIKLRELLEETDGLVRQVDA